MAYASYNEAAQDISRTRSSLVVLTLDFCANTFGVAPCTATGTQCYNTFATCKDRANYNLTTKQYKFTSYDTNLPFEAGERPYIRSVSLLATEIKDSFPVQGRIKIQMVDAMEDTDVGLDPYVSSRTTVNSARYFKKLVARNPNYKGRRIEVYEGFLGLAEALWEKRFDGTIDNIRFASVDSVEIEGMDYIGDLDQVKIPYEFDIKLASTVDSSQTSITFTGDDVQKLGGESTGKTLYLRINDELVNYQSSNYSSVSNAITAITRGALRTLSTSHNATDKVIFAPYYTPKNPFNQMKALLSNAATADEPGAGISTVHIDSTTFDKWRDWWPSTVYEVNVESIIDNEIKIKDLYFDLVSLTNSKSWVGEDLRITVRRNVPNEPGRAYASISDSANIIIDSDDVDINEPSRFTREFLYWDRRPTKDVDKPESFSRRNIHINLTAESSNFYGEVLEEKRMTQWLRASTANASTFVFPNNSLQRRLFFVQNAAPIVSFQAEFKDSTVKTGDYIKLHSDVLCNPDGSPVSSAVYQVIKRTPRDNVIDFEAQYQPVNKVAYIATTGVNTTYSDAPNADREYGYISATNSASSTDAVLPNGDHAYVIY